MLVGTLEALDRLKPGAQVRVSGEQWERVDDGLHRGDQTLPLMAFKGFAEDRLIRTADDLGLTLPSWWTDGSYMYLLVSEDPVSGAFLTVRFHREQYNTVFYLAESLVRTMRAVQAPTVTSTQSWVQALAAMANAIAPVRGMQAAGSPDGLIADLHALCETADGLDAVLTTHGIGRVRTGEVTVTAKGTAKAWIRSGEVTVEADDVTVGWRFAYTYRATTPLGEPCLCSTFDETRYRTHLPEDTVAEDYTTVCTETDCVNRPDKPGKKPRRSTS